MTSRIEAAYGAVRAITGPEYLEPLTDVAQVDAWRQQFRPKQVRLLIVAESHVRRKGGPGFIYDPAYYTPWWRDFFKPAFGTAVTRESLMERGVWIIDMSVIALSGYRKIYPALGNNRPFDKVSPQIFAASWSHHVEREFKHASCCQIVYFDCIKSMLPADVRLSGTPLKFRGPSNAAHYSSPAYQYGTARFIEAVRAAGL